MKKAFTVIELTFVIVIIGILGTVAIPKLSTTRDDAIIAKNIQYVVSAMTEILTYTLARGETKNDLRKMSPILVHLESLNRVTMDISNRKVMIKMGEQVDCLTINIISDTSTEFVTTSFSDSEDRICTTVQYAIKEKDYPLVLRGKLINY